MHSETHMPGIADYQLEEYLRCPHKYYNKYILRQSTDHLNWRQLVQYAVHHAIHEHYSLPAESRSSRKVQEFIDRHWTNKVYRFESEHHFHRVKSTVTQNLLLELFPGNVPVPPLMLFENISVWIDELQAEMSMIFQVVHWTKQSFVIQKFLANEDIDVMTAFVHMASVVSRKAFQTMPEQIEIITLMTGEKHVYRPKEEILTSSLDYLRLMYGLFQETTVFKKSGSVHECTACPFISRCRSESDKRTNPLIH